MTTKVTVDAHAGWPVEVTQVTVGSDGTPLAGSKTIVQPNTTQDFHVWQGSELTIKELPQTT